MVQLRTSLRWEHDFCIALLVLFVLGVEPALAVDADGWVSTEYSQCTGACGGWSARACSDVGDPERCPVQEELVADALFGESVSATDGVVARFQGRVDNGSTWVLMVDLPGPIAAGTRYDLDSAEAAQWIYYEVFGGEVVFEADALVGVVYVDDYGGGAVVVSFDFCVSSSGPDGVAGTADDTARELSCGAAGTWSAPAAPLNGGSRAGGGGTTTVNVVTEIIFVAGEDPYDGYVDDDGGCRSSDDDSGCQSEEDSGGCSDSDGNYDTDGSDGCEGDVVDDDSSGGCCEGDAAAAPLGRRVRAPGRQTVGRLGVWLTLFGGFWWASRRSARRRALGVVSARPE